MNKQKNQTDEFESESYRYVSSYLSDEIKTDFFPNSLLQKTFTTMLDIGCGNGQFLNEWQKKF
jgi:tRNA G46 methylase TrmB